MTRLLLTSLLALTTTLSAVPTQVMMPPERRIYINSVGDVLEWQPGLGIIVLDKRHRSVTRVTKRRSGDGKSIIQLEHETRVDSPSGIGRRIPFEPRRANNRSEDEGQSLMEEVEKPEIIPR
jgi:hypothetical protein